MISRRYKIKPINHRQIEDTPSFITGCYKAIQPNMIEQQKIERLLNLLEETKACIKSKNICSTIDLMSKSQRLLTEIITIW